VFLAIVMDVFRRAVRGWNLDRNLDTDLTLVALQHALSLCIPQIHHRDQGVQYAAQAYTDLLKQYGIQISMAAQGKPEENGYAERFTLAPHAHLSWRTVPGSAGVRTIREEEVDLSEYVDWDDARSQIGCFIEDVYMTKRIHSALGYLTPAEFEAAWRLTQLEQVPPKLD
jgi:putative transposase